LTFYLTVANRHATAPSSCPYHRFGTP